MAPLAKELPGFYYDAEKNRYFPLPPAVPPSSSGAPALQPPSFRQEVL